MKNPTDVPKEVCALNSFLHKVNFDMIKVSVVQGEPYMPLSLYFPTL